MIYFFLVLAVPIAFSVMIYNGLVQLKNKADSAWADIDTQLKRRHDLIPNLVETVKGYSNFEQKTLEEVTKLRSSAIQAKDIKQKESAENMLTETLKGLFAVAENYPDLKANKSFLNLQNTLVEIEEHIQLSRRYYNAVIRDFNTKIEVFPNNLIAKPFKFTRRDFFQLDSEKEREATQVDMQN